MYDSRLVNPSWNEYWAISCQATLSGNIDYGLQAYQLHLKATRIVRSYVGLIQADLRMMTTTHNLTVMHLTQRETDLWTSASSHRTEHQWCTQFIDLHDSLLHIHSSYRFCGAVIIDPLYSILSERLEE